MRLARSLGILAFILCLIPISVSAVDIVDDSKNVQYLFTLSGTSGAHKGDELTLNGVSLVVYFADRPVRKAGHMSLEQFTQMWDEGENNFDEDPPSAELAVFERGSDTHAVLILEKPQVTGDSITFAVKMLEGQIPAAFGHATIFMDSLGVKKSES